MQRKTQTHFLSIVTLIVTVFLFLANPLGAYWPQQVKPTASDGEQFDCFAWSVSSNSDYCLVGARYDDDNGPQSGSAYFYKRNGGAWTQQCKVTASDGSANDMFGYAVSISGEYAIISAVGDATRRGSAYIFKRVDDDWVQQAKLTASDGSEGNEFGISVDICGDYAIVGAYFDDAVGIDAGSAYIFEKPAADWTDMTETTKLFAPNPAHGDFFGVSVSICGNKAIVGAVLSDLGALTDCGSACIFERINETWRPTAHLKASDASTADWFGYSVSICEDYAVVGAVGNDDCGGQTGSAYVFNYGIDSWAEQAKLIPADPAAGDWFGSSVTICGDYIAVGSPSDDDMGPESGSAYIFKREGATWSQHNKLVASDGTVNDYFGTSVSINEDWTIVGAYADDDNGALSGSAYVFKQICPSADLDGDCRIDLNDVRIFTLYWLHSGCGIFSDCEGTDVDKSGEVNFLDYVALAFQRLRSY